MMSTIVTILFGCVISSHDPRLFGEHMLIPVSILDLVVGGQYWSN